MTTCKIILTPASKEPKIFHALATTSAFNLKLCHILLFTRFRDWQFWLFNRIDRKWKNPTRYGWFSHLLPISLILMSNVGGGSRGRRGGIAKSFIIDSRLAPSRVFHSRVFPKTHARWKTQLIAVLFSPPLIAKKYTPLKAEWYSLESSYNRKH